MVDDNEYEYEVVLQENQSINDDDEVIEEEDDDIEIGDDIDSDEMKIPGKHWQKLINTDDKRSILFLADYFGKRFQNTDFTFFLI